MTLDHHKLADVLHTMSAKNQPYLEFIRVPAMSVGVYHLPAGAVDGQQPHTEDEVYYVVSGRATFVRGADSSRKTTPVGAGTILFVERAVEHRFVEIVADLTLIVFFAPAEYSLRERHPMS